MPYVVTMTNKQPYSGFTGLGIAPRLLDVIDSLKFKDPTPIQQRSIPIGIAGNDLIAIAQTGTGKTLAFGIPMIQRLAQIKGNGLVLLPTRELAIQVDEALHPFCRAVGMRTAVLIGGESVSVQRRALEKEPRIIIATPGRLLDLLNQRTVTLSETEILVLDEADRMLDMGFAPQINKILATVPRKRQTLLFSATMPKEIVTIAQKHMEIPVSVEIAPPGTTVERVIQEVFFVGKDAKTRLLEVILRQYPGPVLIFTRTKHGARRLAYQVRLIGHAAAEIHSNRSLAQRRAALEGFKSGKYRVLVATDIAARGIDVTGIEIVINYDLPSNSEDYVHRIGRTARAGRAGRAISFATLDQRGEVKNIEHLIRGALTVKPVPMLPPGRQHPQTITTVSSSGPPQPRPRAQHHPPSDRANQNRRPSGRRRARRL
jgi:ATP-dependent RNA helicase RhlE